MISDKPVDSSLSLLLIEAGLTLIGLLVAFTAPQLVSAGFAAIERAACRLALCKRSAVFSVAAVFLVLRCSLLPFFPGPHPFSTDDFSFLLAADTFAHGRLTNSTPMMWIHLESIHITMQPKYMSMYFPGPGLLMAAGKVLFGNPWIAILLSGAVMCAALCWMLQAWLPPGWALLGGFIAVLRIGLFSYWVNTYTGGATLSVTGGALVLGAMPRLIKTGSHRYALLMAIGILLLILSRPYEGFLLCIPVAIALVFWIIKGKNRLPIPVLMRRAAVPLALVAATVGWLGYYDMRNFGRATTLPYTIARQQYAVVPYYIWQTANSIPQYRHAEMRRFYTESETKSFSNLNSPGGLVRQYQIKFNTTILFFAGFALLPPLFMVWRVVRDRRMRFFVWSAPLWIGGMAIGVFLIPHYLAPFTAAIYVLGLQAMRHLRQWKVGRRAVGYAVVRFSVMICIVMAGVRIFAEPLHMSPAQWPTGPWLCSWVGPGPFGTDRARVANELDGLPGKHLVLVRYTATHQPGDEWVYNEADPDHAKTVWAREMDPQQNQELLRYYSNRDVWLVQPDVEQGRLTVYPDARVMQAKLSAAR